MWGFCGHFMIQVAENSVEKQIVIIFGQRNSSGSEQDKGRV